MIYNIRFNFFLSLIAGILMLYSISHELRSGYITSILILCIIVILAIIYKHHFSFNGLIPIVCLCAVFQLTSSSPMYTGIHMITLIIVIGFTSSLGLSELKKVLIYALEISLILSVVFGIGFGHEQNFFINTFDLMNISDIARYRAGTDGFGNQALLVSAIIILTIYTNTHKSIIIPFLFALLIITGSRTVIVALIIALLTLSINKNCRSSCLKLIFVSLVFLGLSFTSSNSLLSIKHRLFNIFEVSSVNTQDMDSSVRAPEPEIIDMQNSQDVTLAHNMLIDAYRASPRGALVLLMISSWFIFIKFYMRKKSNGITKETATITAMFILTFVSGLGDLTLIFTKPQIGTVIYFYCLTNGLQDFRSI